MAGNVEKFKVRQREVDLLLVEGVALWRWEEGDPNLQKLVFQVDEDGFFLYARGEDMNKVYDTYIWDFALVSDVRTGKMPKDSRVSEAMSAITVDEAYEDCALQLVYRRDGIVNLDFHNLVCSSPEIATRFKRSVNRLTFNMLHAHAAPCVFFRKNYVKILTHANGHGQIFPKYIHRAMLLRVKAETQYVDKFLAQFNILKKTDKGDNYLRVEDFTESIYQRMIDQLLNNRSQDLDIVFETVQKKKGGKLIVTLADFHQFLNADQRDPRLNEILNPIMSKAQAKALILRHERGRTDDRLTPKGIMEFLMSEDNNILDLCHLDQDMDMNMPLTHYFINSSHNTYLTGHQLRSASTTEMYTQTLLLGCRCLELDCWPTNDNEDITITHGGTLCGKVGFKEVVEAINEFAFVASDYPVILSIENHCKRSDRLLKRMATIFTLTFGDKLMKIPFDDCPLEPGIPLPSPERLKRKILLKDKVKRQKDKAVSVSELNTLPRGATMQTVEEVPEENAAKPPSSATATEAPGSATAAEPLGSATGVSFEPPPQLSQDSAEGKGKAVGEGGVAEATEGTGSNPTTDAETSAVGPSAKPVECDDSEKETTPPVAQGGEGGMAEASSGESAALVNGTAEKPPTTVDSNVELTLEELSKMHKLVARPSETEALVSGPLIGLLNYCTGITFEGFAMADKLNCSFYMSSFVEEKGLNHIKSSTKDFVKYNMRQMSRIYPQGTRINSSNYMPQIYWNIGSQLVALNYQTSDLPMQLNLHKFEFNGANGYLLKPWVMRQEKARGGTFNPFSLSKIEDVVPAKLRVKIISGLFLTEKRTSCYVEVEVYGLPADTNRHKFYTKRVPAPHPAWNEEVFTFKRILLPELAMLRVAVFDDDRELVGQRFLPVNTIQPGFRHIPLRDRHTQPLPLAMLFVHIKVEDWVPDGLEDVVAALMDPLSFASKAIEELCRGEFDDNEDSDDGPIPPVGHAPDDPSTLASAGQATPPQRTKAGSVDIGLPPVKDKRPSDVGLPKQLSGTSVSLKATKPAGAAAAGMGTLGKSQLSGFEDTLPILDLVKSRQAKEALPYNSKLVMEHTDYLKLLRKSTKAHIALYKKQEKTLKATQSKVGKKAKADVTVVTDLEARHRTELAEFDRAATEERHQLHRTLLGSLHKKQYVDLERVHLSDLKQVSVEVGQMMKKHRKSSLTADKTADSLERQVELKQIEEKGIRLGRKVREELDRSHTQERAQMEASQKQQMDELAQSHIEERRELAGDAAAL